MEQYIPKSAVEAEIERRMKLRQSSYKACNSLCDFIAWEELEYLKEEFLPTLKVKEVGVDFGDPKGDKSAKCIIDTKTLEVKEVDFETKLDEWMKTGPLTSYPWCDIPDAIKITAEHFFELGLKAQKGE